MQERCTMQTFDGIYLYYLEDIQNCITRTNLSFMHHSIVGIGVSLLGGVFTLFDICFCSLSNVVVIFFIIKISMSKPTVSPYRRNVYNNKPTLSPYREQPYKLAQKSKLSHSFIADHTTDKKPGNREETSRLTDKKKHYQYQPMVNHSRVDTLLQQNKFLLAENNELTNLLNDRSRIIIALQQKLEQQIAQEVLTLEEIQYEKNRFLEEYNHKMREHSARCECLMDEIAQLNQDIYQLELKKNRQIQYIKESYSREHKSQLDNILSNHSETVELMQIQNSKLKEVINNRDHEIECINHELKSTSDRLKNKCEELQRNLNHALHLKKIELSEMKLHYEKIIQDIKRQNEQNQQVSAAQYENQMRRIKKELLVRQVEVQKLGNDISSNEIDNQTKINDLYQKKGDLENEICELEAFQKKLLFEESQRIKNIAQAEIENTEGIYQKLIESLKSQNAKLGELNETRGNQITRLYAQIEDFRVKHEQECDDLRLQIENLKALVHNEKQTYDEQNEALKTKIAHLRHADIHSLQEYYQNELATMAEDLQAKDQIINENREKIHWEIQEKTELRKNFEIQVSKLKIQIGELELRVAGVLHERKEDIANFGSQMQLTSMTLLRTAEEKEKYAIFSQSEKQRLQKMIENKDSEIEQLNEKIRFMRDNHSDEIKNKDEEIGILKNTIEELESNLKKQKYFLENQIKKKDAINKNDKQYYESEMARLKKEAAEEYNKIVIELGNEKGLIDSQRIRLKKMGEELSGELKQIKQFREQDNLDKEIAENESKSRHMSEKEIMEVNLKTYYQRQIYARENEIKDLRQQVSELNSDIRAHIEKEQKYEQKLQKLLESQQKLRDMEQRVLAMGQQNNLVKNLTEIVKNRRK